MIDSLIFELKVLGKLLLIVIPIVAGFAFAFLLLVLRVKGKSMWGFTEWWR